MGRGGLTHINESPVYPGQFKGQFEIWRDDKKEEEAWKRGEIDARACVHCDTMTYAHNTPLLMQTNFKAAPPPYLDEIQRDMRVVVQNANHVILAGYSLPPDDVTYRAFLAARVDKAPRNGKSSGSRVRCSVVGFEATFGNRWWYPNDLDTCGTLPDVVKHAREIFGVENVRYFGGGIPNVFLDSRRIVSNDAVNKLLKWAK